LFVKSPGGLLADERRRLIAERLHQSGSVLVTALQEEFGTSAMTVRRDLAELERMGVARRTHGGAVVPGLSSHEDSFVQRLGVALDAKERLAEAAVALVQPGEALFLDSSTTAYFVARGLVRDGVRCTVLTNAVPVLQLISESEAAHVEAIGLGGRLRKMNRSFVGPNTVAAASAHFADHAFFSVRGIADERFLTDPDALEAEVKRTMIRQANQPVLLIDGSKFDRTGLSVIAPVTDVALVIAADADPQSLKALERAGVATRRA
jgi:DeoR family transcriptional regulator of aga operon